MRSSTKADTLLATASVTTSIFFRDSPRRPKSPAPAAAAVPSARRGSLDSGECHKHPPVRDAKSTVSAKTNSVPRVTSRSTDSFVAILSRSRSHSSTCCISSRALVCHVCRVCYICLSRALMCRVCMCVCFGGNMERTSTIEETRNILPAAKALSSPVQKFRCNGW